MLVSAVNNSILHEYVMQTEETALNTRRKMGSYLTDENKSKTPDPTGGTEGAKPQKEKLLTHCIYCKKLRE